MTALPHFALDRYATLLRQVEIHEMSDLKTVLNRMEQIGWVRWLGQDEFRFLRPFHRVFSKCIDVVQAANSKGTVTQATEANQTPSSSAEAKE